MLPEQIKEVEILAYDFTLSSGQPLGTIEITIPYDDTNLKEEEEIFAVAGKYYNEEKKEWEDVVYKVDTKKNVVKIITNHLSTYGVFKIVNPTKRNAYISEINVYADYMTTKKAEALLNTYGKQEKGWKESVVSSTLETFGSFPMFIANSVPNVITLGGAYDSYVTKKFNDVISNLGIATACAQLAYDAYQNGFEGEEIAISAMKNTLSFAINFATPSIQLAYVGVGMIDYALTDISTFAVENKYRSTKNMYEAYYNRTENKRTIKVWTKLFDKIYKDNKSNPGVVLDLIKKEIDRYVKEYWKVAAVDYDSWIDSYDSNGSLAKYPWPEAKHRENISNIFKNKILADLQPTLRLMSRNMFLDSIVEREKEYNKVANYYNKKYTVTIRENLKTGKASTWQGYYARFSPLSSTAEARNWTVKLDESGFGKITFTLLGHLNADFPMKIDLYKNGADIENGKKALTINLKPFKDTSQTVNLTPRKVTDEETIEEPNEELEKPIVDSPNLKKEDNPWYEITLKATDNSKAFAGWSAVVGYTSDSSPDLKNIYKSFNSKGECKLYIQKSDYNNQINIDEIWLYKSKTDLLAKKKADVKVSFSLGGTRSGELQGEPLYKLTVKAKPKEEPKPDILESISGKYSSYMIYSLYIEEYDLMGTPQEMKNEERFAPNEKPSADVTLHYNGSSLSYLSSANPYQSFGNEILLDKLGDYRYEKTFNNNGVVTKYSADIISAGTSAKITIEQERKTPKKVLKQEYILHMK